MAGVNDLILGGMRHDAQGRPILRAVDEDTALGSDRVRVANAVRGADNVPEIVLDGVPTDTDLAALQADLDALQAQVDGLGGATTYEPIVIAVADYYNNALADPNFEGWAPSDPALTLHRVGDRVTLDGYMEYFGPANRATYESVVTSITSVLRDSAIPAGWRPLSLLQVLAHTPEESSVTANGVRLWSLHISSAGTAAISVYHDVQSPVPADWIGLVGDSADEPGGYAIIYVNTSWSVA